MKQCAYRFCGKEIPPDRAVKGMKYCISLHRHQEHALRRHESKEKKKKRFRGKTVKSIQVLCPCGCWNFFWTETNKPNRKYFKAYPCRHNHYKKLHGVTQKTEQVISRYQNTAEGQGLPCHKIVMGNKDRKIACADYPECLEGVAMGEPWKCSDGVNRYLEPHDVQKNTMGPSVAICQSRSYQFT